MDGQARSISQFVAPPPSLFPPRRRSEMGCGHSHGSKRDPVETSETDSSRVPETPTTSKENNNNNNNNNQGEEGEEAVVDLEDITYELKHGGLVVLTSIGPVQFGIPPEVRGGD